MFSAAPTSFLTIRAVVASSVEGEVPSFVRDVELAVLVHLGIGVLLGKVECDL